MIYTMQIERRVHNSGCVVGEIKQHPFHLGSDLAVAESFVMEMLLQPDVVSVALRGCGAVLRIYDYRDLGGSDD